MSSSHTTGLRDILILGGKSLLAKNGVTMVAKVLLYRNSAKGGDYPVIPAVNFEYQRYCSKI